MGNKVTWQITGVCVGYKGRHVATAWTLIRIHQLVSGCTHLWSWEKGGAIGAASLRKGRNCSETWKGLHKFKAGWQRRRPEASQAEPCEFKFPEAVLVSSSWDAAGLNHYVGEALEGLPHLPLGSWSSPANLTTFCHPYRLTCCIVRLGVGLAVFCKLSEDIGSVNTFGTE